MDKRPSPDRDDRDQPSTPNAPSSQATEPVANGADYRSRQQTLSMGDESQDGPPTPSMPPSPEALHDSKTPLADTAREFVANMRSPASEAPAARFIPPAAADAAGKPPGPPSDLNAFFAPGSRHSEPSAKRGPPGTLPPGLAKSIGPRQTSRPPPLPSQRPSGGLNKTLSGTPPPPGDIPSPQSTRSSGPPSAASVGTNRRPTLIGAAGPMRPNQQPPAVAASESVPSQTAASHTSAPLPMPAASSSLKELHAAVVSANSSAAAGTAPSPASNAAQTSASSQQPHAAAQAVSAQPVPAQTPASSFTPPAPGPIHAPAPRTNQRRGEKIAWAIVGGLSAIAAVYALLLSPSDTTTAPAKVTQAAPTSDDPAPLPTNAAAGLSNKPAPAPAMSSGVSSARVKTGAQWVVRQETSQSGCEQALQRPFQLKGKQLSHMAAAPYQHARKALVRGNNATAIRSLCLAAEWYIAGPSTYALGQLYLKLGDFEKAGKWLERVGPSPKRRRVQADELLGDLLAQRDDHRQTLSHLQSIHPDAVTPQAREGLARRYAKAGRGALLKKDYWYAERLFRRALVLQEEQPRATAGLSQALLHQGFDGPALGWAKRAQELAPGNWDAEYAMADAALKNSQIDLAERALQSLSKLAPKDRRLKILGSRLKQLR